MAPEPRCAADTAGAVRTWARLTRLNCYGLAPSSTFSQGYGFSSGLTFSVPIEVGRTQFAW